MEDQKKEAHRQAQAKYRDSGAYRKLTLTFNSRTDADILEYLDTLPSKLGRIKELLREDIARSK